MKRRTTAVVSAEVVSVPDFCEETMMTTMAEVVVVIVVPFMKNPGAINLRKLNVLKLSKLKIALEDL